MPEVPTKIIQKQDTIDIKAAVAKIDNLMAQKKAFASLIGLNVLSKYLREKGISVTSQNNNDSGLLLLNDFDLASIIVENNIKIAVSVIVGDNYSQMCIPKSHFSSGMMADIYVGVRVETTIDKAELTGFIEGIRINRQRGNNKYVFVNADNLKPIEHIKQAICKPGINTTFHFAEDHQKAKELFFRYIENRLPPPDKEFLAKHISSCAGCSQEFNHIIELDNMIKSVGSKLKFESFESFESLETLENVDFEEVYFEEKNQEYQQESSLLTDDFVDIGVSVADAEILVGIEETEEDFLDNDAYELYEEENGILSEDQDVSLEEDDFVNEHVENVEELVGFSDTELEEVAEDIITYPY